MYQITSCWPQEPHLSSWHLSPSVSGQGLQSRGNFSLPPPALEYLISQKRSPTVVTCSQVCFLLSGSMTTGLYVWLYPKVTAVLKKLLPLDHPWPIAQDCLGGKNAETLLTLQPLRTKPAPQLSTQRLHPRRLPSQPRGSPGPYAVSHVGGNCKVIWNQ